LGYTHYWYEKTTPARLPFEAVLLIQRIVDEARRDKLIQLEWNDSHDPIVTDRCIQFNGVGKEGHETFVYNLEEQPFLPAGEDYFSCCKTAKKPYDAVVMKVLIVLTYHLGDVFAIKSDGRLDEWEPALKEMAEKHGIMLDGWRPR